jgi:hypothetical protein
MYITDVEKLKKMELRDIRYPEKRELMRLGLVVFDEINNIFHWTKSENVAYVLEMNKMRNKFSILNVDKFYK